MNTWAEVTGLGITEISATTTVWMYTLDPLDRSATGVNNTRVLEAATELNVNLFRISFLVCLY